MTLMMFRVASNGAPNDEGWNWLPGSQQNADMAGRRRFACPCCGFLTLPVRGDYELCPVCFWEDDGQGEEDADEMYGGPNGSLTLTQARANFAAFGACEPRFIRSVRPPLPEERPDAAVT